MKESVIKMVLDNNWADLNKYVESTAAKKIKSKIDQKKKSIIEAINEDSASPKQIDKDEKIINAIKDDDFKLVDTILDSDIDFYDDDFNHYKVANVLVKEGSIKMIEHFIKKGYDPYELLSKHNNTITTYAILSGSKEKFNYIMNKYKINFLSDVDLIHIYKRMEELGGLRDGHIIIPGTNEKVPLSSITKDHVKK